MSHADAHAHDHDHPPHLAHHWETSQQQFEAGKLGMWLFLATEVLLFGGLFCGYTAWRFHHPEMFRFGSQFLDTRMGAINTAVLIASSMTMAMAVTFAQKGRQKALVICLVLTLMGAFGFLVIKYFEYSHKFHEGYFPGMAFYEKHELAHTWDPELPIAAGEITAVDTAARAPRTGEDIGLPAGVPVEVSTVGPPAQAPGGLNEGVLAEMETAYRAGDEPALEMTAGSHDDERHETHVHTGEHFPHPLQDPQRPANAHMFFNIYFMMTGLHGVHVLLGAGVIVWLIVLSLKGRFGPEYFTPVDLGGLYWHVVDLIWIFLFPLFYLI